MKMAQSGSTAKNVMVALAVGGAAAAGVQLRALCLERAAGEVLKFHISASGYTICSGWNTSSNFSAVKKPSATQASLSEIFSL